MERSMADDLNILRLLDPHGLPHAIECDGRMYVPQETCTYRPTEVATCFDENDVEIETNEPSEDCGTFICSSCGFEMLFGYDMGWFEEEPPYKPYFKFCPGCGARVVADGQGDERSTDQEIGRKTAFDN